MLEIMPYVLALGCELLLALAILAGCVGFVMDTIITFKTKRKELSEIENCSDHP